MSPSDATRNLTVTFLNFTTQTLTLQLEALDQGTWLDGMSPPKTIGPASVGSPSTAGFASEPGGFMTGIQGAVVYVFEDGQTVLRINIDDPYHGSNKCSVPISGPEASQYAANYSGGDGDNADVTVSLTTA